MAVALKARYPDKLVVIAGDNDVHVEQTQGINLGRTQLEEAARAVGGKAFFPIFAPGEQSENPKAFTDFNDLAVRSVLGKSAVERHKARTELLAQQQERGPRAIWRSVKVGLG